VLAASGANEAFIEQVNLRCSQRLVSGAQPSPAG
jgi:hypothetical protein